MSIQNKPDYKIFAGSAKSGEVVSFPDIARGWGVTIDKTGEIPPMEWFNAIGKRVDEWLMYLTQRGVSQWDISVEYPTMAMVQYGGSFYVSLKDNKGQDPTSSSATWENIKKWIGMDGKLNTSDVIQSTGSSTTKVMSQKAVTDALTLKVNYSTIVQETGQNSHSIMGQKAVTDALGLKVNNSAIVQTTGQNDYSVMSQKAVTDAINAKSVDVLQQTGTSIKAAMSQKAVTDALDLKVNYSAIVQTTGQNQYSLMGQKAVTDALTLKVNYSAIVQTTGQNDYSVMSQKAVTDAMFGVGQTWKDVMSERASGTTYTNSTGKPISVSVTQLGGQDITMVIEVGGVVISRPSSTGVSRCFITFMVPAGVAYKVTSTGSEIINWAELRA